MRRDDNLQLAALAARNHGIFTYEEALACGVTDHEIRGGTGSRWHRIHTGVYRFAGVPPAWRGSCLAAVRAATDPAAISHESAAALYELPYANDNLVVVTCRRWKRSRKDKLIVRESTRFSVEDITVVDGIPVVTPERLVLELAGLHPHPNAVEKVIQAARRKRLITYESMRATFDRLARRGVDGVKATRIALDRWDPSSKPTESDMETWLIQILRAHGLPEPVTQFVVLDEFGNFVARTDAALPEWRVTIEYQSKQEHLDEFQSARDDRRRNKIIAAGYKPIHARYADLRSGGHDLVNDIRRARRNSA